MTVQRRASGAPFVREVEPLTGHTVLRARSRHGLEVVVAPLPGFTKTYAVLSAICGSLDTALPDDTPLPAGTAHFLEHRMFHTPQGDVFDIYAERGACANAYTTYAHTGYLFWCTSRFEENLDTLLETLGSVDVDAQGVEREREIIGQEIAMHDDDSSWRGYSLVLQALYRRHPVRIDIAGTRASIAAIDAPLLERAHAAYYHPRNLVLVVAGDVEADAVLARADARPPPVGRGRRNRRAAVAEPRSVAHRSVSEAFSVARPHVHLVWKDTAPGTGRRLVRRRVITSIALEALFHDGERIQAPFYREGLVDDSFQAAYEAEGDFAHAIVSAEVDDVDGYQRRLLRAVRRAAEQGVGGDEVERVRRRMLGQRLRVFNGPESLGQGLLAGALEGVGPGAGLEVLRAATARSVTRRLRDLVAQPHAWAVLVPR